MSHDMVTLIIITPSMSVPITLLRHYFHIRYCIFSMMIFDMPYFQRHTPRHYRATLLMPPHCFTLLYAIIVEPSEPIEIRMLSLICHDFPLFPSFLRHAAYDDDMLFLDIRLFSRRWWRRYYALSLFSYAAEMPSLISSHFHFLFMIRRYWYFQPFLFHYDAITWHTAIFSIRYFLHIDDIHTFLFWCRIDWKAAHI